MAGYKKPTPSVDDDNRETISEDIGNDYNYKKFVTNRSALLYQSEGATFCV